MLLSPGKGRATSGHPSDHATRLTIRSCFFLRPTKSYVLVGQTTIHHKVEEVHLGTGMNKAEGRHQLHVQVL